MHKRKNYLIKKKFQYGFSLKFIALLFLESLLICGFFMYISTDTITTGFQNSVLTVEKTQSYFLIPFLLITLIVVVAIGLVAMVVLTLLSHRIAGPIYRFEQVIKDISKGDLTTHVRLRRTDQLEDVQKELNVLISSLNQRLGRIKTHLTDVQELLSHKKDPDVLERIDGKIRDIHDEINHFKISTDEPDAP